MQQALIKGIVEHLRQGDSESDIKKHVLEAGYSKADFKAAYALAKQEFDMVYASMSSPDGSQPAAPGDNPVVGYENNQTNAGEAETLSVVTEGQLPDQNQTSAPLDQIQSQPTTRPQSSESGQTSTDSVVADRLNSVQTPVSSFKTKVTPAIIVGFVLLLVTVSVLGAVTMGVLPIPGVVLNLFG